MLPRIQRREFSTEPALPALPFGTAEGVYLSFSAVPSLFRPCKVLWAINFVVTAVICFETSFPFLKTWRTAKALGWGWEGVRKSHFCSPQVPGCSSSPQAWRPAWQCARDDVNQLWTCCLHSSQEGRCTTCVYRIRKAWYQAQPLPPSSWGNSKLTLALLQDPRESEGPPGSNRSPGPLLFSKMALRILT